MQYIVSYSTSIWFCLRRVPAMGMNGTFLRQVLGPYYASRKYQLGWYYLYQCLTKLRTVEFVRWLGERSSFELSREKGR